METGYLIVLPAFEFPSGLAMVLEGNMAAGIRRIEEGMQRFEQWGCGRAVILGHLFLGEIYLQMAAGTTRPPLRIMLRNLGFLARTMPVVARKARHHLEQALKGTREVPMPGFLVRVLLDLGVLPRQSGGRTRHVSTSKRLMRWRAPMPPRCETRSGAGWNRYPRGPSASGTKDMARSARAVMVKDGFTPGLADIAAPSIT
jgi:hypothetical protein